MTMNTLLNAGDQIDSGCLKCKDVTNHTIVALVGEKIAKVQCNVCGGRHNYRSPQPAAAIKKSGVKKAAGKSSSSLAVRRAADNFTKILKGQGVDGAIPYATTTIFSKDDLINHPTFGLGVVTATIPPNKIELTFNEGPRILICQLAAPVHLATGSGKSKRKKRVLREAASDGVTPTTG